MEPSKDETLFVDNLFYDSLLKFGFRGMHIDPDSPEAVEFKGAITKLCLSQRPKIMGKLVNILV